MLFEYSSTRPEVFCKKDVPEYFVKVIRKYHLRSSRFIKWKVYKKLLCYQGWSQEEGR